MAMPIGYEDGFSWFRVHQRESLRLREARAELQEAFVRECEIHDLEHMWRKES